jgi:hypothetical protein
MGARGVWRMRCSCSDGWWWWARGWVRRGMRCARFAATRSIQATLVYEVVCSRGQQSVSFLCARPLLYLDGCGSGYGGAVLGERAEALVLALRCGAMRQRPTTSMVGRVGSCEVDVDCGGSSRLGRTRYHVDGRTVSEVDELRCLVGAKSVWRNDHESFSQTELVTKCL